MVAESSDSFSIGTIRKGGFFVDGEAGLRLDEHRSGMWDGGKMVFCNGPGGADRFVLESGEN